MLFKLEKKGQVNVTFRGRSFVFKANVTHDIPVRNDKDIKLMISLGLIKTAPKDTTKDAKAKAEKEAKEAKIAAEKAKKAEDKAKKNR